MNKHNTLTLAANKIAISYDDDCLIADLSFTIKSGQLLQIDGRNGSGKTSLLRALCGLKPLSGGEILWNSQPIEQVLPIYHSSLAYIGHNSGIKDNLTALENLTLMRELSLAHAKINPQQALAKLGLSGFDDTLCRKLSAGQKRKVALARLLLLNTPLWILDEPFTAIDSAGKTHIETMLLEHIADGGLIVLSTHHDVKLPEEYITKITLGEQNA